MNGVRPADSRGGRASLRARLALLYGALLAVAGCVLLALIYLLVDQSLPQGLMDAGIAAQTEPGQLPTQTLPTTEVVQQVAMRAVLTSGTAALLVVVLVGVALAWFISGRALRPLTIVTGIAHRIAREGVVAQQGPALQERIPVGAAGDEVATLARAFNAMLDRLDGAFESQRRFVANASHELRTPIAISRARIDLALRRHPDDAALSALADDIAGLNRRQEHLIEGMLMLARADHAGSLPGVTAFEDVDLAEVVQEVLAERGGALRGGALVRALDAAASSSPAHLKGEAVLLRQLVANLVDNAIHHNDATDPDLTVRVGAVAEGAELTIENAGPIIGADEVDGLLEPFRRQQADRLAGHGGAGLGLAIVRSIVRLHRGILRITPRDGGGLVVQVRLPAHPDHGEVREAGGVA